jgi:hypothetical protein
MNNMKKIIYLFLLATTTLVAQKKKETYELQVDDVTCKIVKNQVIINSAVLKADRRVLLISDKDTIYDIRKTGKFQKTVTMKEFPLVLEVYTYNKNGGWCMKSQFYWTYTMYYD